MAGTEKYTEAEALDIAVMLFYRKARRVMSDAEFAKILRAIDDVAPGAREALGLAELRGDSLRDAIGGGFSGEWPTRMIEDDEE